MAIEEFYDYIDSDTIRDYCKATKHKFSLLECAGIVYWSTNYDLHEKQEAYRKLLTLCENRSEWGTFDLADIESLQRHLRRLIAEIDAAYRFLARKPKPGTLFAFTKSRHYEYDGEVFTSVQSALDYMLRYKDCGLWNGIHAIRPDAPKHIGQVLNFRSDGLLYEADGFTPEDFGKEDETWPEDAYIGYPLPFENGDLLVIDQEDKKSFAVFSKPAPEKKETCLVQHNKFDSISCLGIYYSVVRDLDIQPRIGRFDIIRREISVFEAQRIRLADPLIWDDKPEEAGFLRSLSALMKQMPYDTPSIYGFLLDFSAFLNSRSPRGPERLLYGDDNAL